MRERSYEEEREDVRKGEQLGLGFGLRLGLRGERVKIFCKEINPFP